MKFAKIISLFASLVHAESELNKQSGNVFVQKLFGDDNPYNGIISLGTPAQEITVIFDSGSYDPNVLAPNASTCGDDSCIFGTYASTDSSTSNLTSEKYYVGYGSSDFYTYSAGNFAYDILSIGDKAISNFKFADIYHSDDIVNIFGIGYGYDTYSGLHTIDQFISKDLISKKIYSIYYSNTTQTGGLVFGGIDTSKYYGTLETVDMAKNDLDVEVSAIGTDCGVIISSAGVFSVDTGTTYTYLTTDNYHLFHLAIGASKVTNYTFDTYTQDDGSASYVLKCSKAPEIKFWFAGKEVTFYPNSYALPLIDQNGNFYRDSDGDEICGTSFFSGTDENILGAYQLKDIFTVVDIENRQFLFAQGFDSESEEVIAVTGDVPGAVTATTYEGNAKTITVPSITPTISLSIEGLDNVGQRYTGPFSSNTCSVSDKASTIHRSRTETTQVAVCLTCSASLTSSDRTSATSALVKRTDININSTTTETITSCSISDCKIPKSSASTVLQTSVSSLSPLILPSSSTPTPLSPSSLLLTLLSYSNTTSNLAHSSFSDQRSLQEIPTDITTNYGTTTTYIKASIGSQYANSSTDFVSQTPSSTTTFGSLIHSTEQPISSASLFNSNESHLSAIKVSRTANAITITNVGLGSSDINSQVSETFFTENSISASSSKSYSTNNLSSTFSQELESSRTSFDSSTITAVTSAVTSAVTTDNTGKLSTASEAYSISISPVVSTFEGLSSKISTPFKMLIISLFLLI